MDSAVDFSAVAANNYVGKHMRTAEAALLSVLTEVATAAADHFFLRLHERRRGDKEDVGTGSELTPISWTYLI